MRKTFLLFVCVFAVAAWATAAFAFTTDFTVNPSGVALPDDTGNAFGDGNWTWEHSSNWYNGQPTTYGDARQNYQTFHKADYADWPSSGGGRAADPTGANYPWVLQTALQGDKGLGGQYSDFIHGLGTSGEVVLSATFRVRGSRGLPNGSTGGTYGFGAYGQGVNNNNDTNAGAALMTLVTKNGGALALNVHQAADDTYTYELNKVNMDSDHTKMTSLANLGYVDDGASGGKGQEDPTWRTVYLYANANGQIKAYLRTLHAGGTITEGMVLDTVLPEADRISIDGFAQFGSGNAWQLSTNSGARLDALWLNASVTYGTAGTPFAPVPEPSSLLALGTGIIGLVGVIRRRK